VSREGVPETLELEGIVELDLQGQRSLYFSSLLSGEGTEERLKIHNPI